MATAATQVNLAPSSAPLTAEDRAILGNVESSIREGQELKKWWEENRDSRVRLNRFPVARQVHDPDENYGFLLEANLSSGAIPVAGVIQDQLFTWPKTPAGCQFAPQRTRDQLRAFILRHFMRLTAAQPPIRAQAAKAGNGGPFLGWGYEQVYYKSAATGQIGKFSDSQRTAILPLDSVGPTYSWVVFKVNIFHFEIPIDLMSSGTGPHLTLSLTQPVHAVMTPDFLVDEEDPEPGVIGQYGYGYSVVPNPAYQTVFAAGPSQIRSTIETLTFRVLESGEVRAHMNFITPQPPRIANFDPVRSVFAAADRVSFGAASKLLAPLKTVLQGIEPQIDPVYLGINLMNAMTAGLAADEFDVSKDRLFRTLMNLHFTDVFKMFNLAASHFAMVSDWTDSANLPEWAKTGAFHPAD